jgi:DNA-binding NarL/FixJ family response regulator
MAALPSLVSNTHSCAFFVPLTQMTIDRLTPVLVVDDHGTMIKIIRGQLRELGFVDVHEANSGAEALTKMALETLAIGVMVVDARGTLRFANAIADRLLRAGRGIVARNGRLHAQDQRRDAALHRAISEAARAAVGCVSQPGGLLAIPRPGETRLSVLVCPLPPDALGLQHPQLGVVIFIGNPDDQGPLPQALLARYYNLTPAEARLTEALVAGARLQDYAEEAGIALQTAKTQLKQVFAKTNHHRQAELVRDVLRNPLLRMTAAPRAH